MIHSFIINDYDRDGWQDLVTTRYDGSTGTEWNGFENYGFYKNTNGIFSSVFSLIARSSGCCFIGPGLDAGDINNDGLVDLVSVSQGVHVVKQATPNNQIITFGDIAKFYRTPTFGDFDADGDLDLLSNSAYSNGSLSSDVYRNDNGTFILNNSEADSFFQWVDFDNDGDLDIIGDPSVGKSSTYTKGYFFRNNRGANKLVPNTPPSAPKNLCTSRSSNVLTMSWSPATDQETPSPGLTYNIYVKYNGSLIVSPLADLSTGKRKIVKRGNVDHATSFTIFLPAANGTVEWGVQAIDNQYIGSTFTNTATNNAGTLSTATMCGTYSTNNEIRGGTIAAPQACTSNAVTITSGATVTIAANKTIRLLPGFNTQAGSIVNAKIISDIVPCNLSSGGRLTVDEHVYEKETSNSSIKIYPNPSEGVINFEAVFNNSNNTTLEVIDINGHVLLSKTYENLEMINDRFDISSFAAGIYMIKIQNETDISTVRIVKL